MTASTGGTAHHACRWRTYDYRTATISFFHYGTVNASRHVCRHRLIVLSSAPSRYSLTERDMLFTKPGMIRPKVAEIRSLSPAAEITHCSICPGIWSSGIWGYEWTSSSLFGCNPSRTSNSTSLTEFAVIRRHMLEESRQDRQARVVSDLWDGDMKWWTTTDDLYYGMCRVAVDEICEHAAAWSGNDTVTTGKTWLRQQ